MKNLKTTIITALLLFAAVGGAVAQEKYEYAMLYQLDQLVFWNAEKTEIIKFDSTAGWIRGTMKKLNELSEQGWEVYSVTETLLNKKDGISQVKYHLRRKKS
jgi:hypothetical protein